MKKAKVWLKRFLPAGCIALAAALVLMPILGRAYPDRDDTIYHAHSIMGLEKDNTIVGIFNTQIFEEMGDGYGYGEGIFYPQLSHQIAAVILHLIKPFGLGVFTAMRATHILGLVLSGILMYLLVRRATENKVAATLSAILYMTFPYHVGDILIRDAFAELWTFVFLPVAVYGLYELLAGNYRKFHFLFTIGFVGMINSHLVLAVYAAILMFVGAVWFIKRVWNKQEILAVALSAASILIITAPFTVPLAMNMVNAEYWVQSGAMGVNVEHVNSFRLGWSELFLPSGTRWDFLAVNVLAVVLVAALLLNWKKAVRKENKYLTVSMLVMLGVCLVISSELFDWAWMPKFLLNIQFPWRLELFMTFALCLLSGIALDAFKVERNVALFIMVIVSAVAGVTMVQRNVPTREMLFNVYNNRDYYPTVMFETYEEYFPERAGADVVVLSGEAEISDFADDGRRGVEFSVRNGGGAKLEIPRIYYLGYVVSAEKDGAWTELTYEMDEKGFVSVYLPEDYGRVKVEFKNAPFGAGLAAASGAMMVAMAGYYIYEKRKERK